MSLVYLDLPDLNCARFWRILEEWRKEGFWFVIEVRGYIYSYIENEYICF